MRKTTIVSSRQTKQETATIKTEDDALLRIHEVKNRKGAFVCGSNNHALKLTKGLFLQVSGDKIPLDPLICWICHVEVQVTLRICPFALTLLPMGL